MKRSRMRLNVRLYVSIVKPASLFTWLETWQTLDYVLIGSFCQLVHKQRSLFYKTKLPVTHSPDYKPCSNTRSEILDTIHQPVTSMFGIICGLLAAIIIALTTIPRMFWD